MEVNKHLVRRNAFLALIVIFSFRCGEDEEQPSTPDGITISGQLGLSTGSREMSLFPTRDSAMAGYQLYCVTFAEPPKAAKGP